MSKQDFVALQEFWRYCVLRYLASSSKELGMEIIEKFIDSLVDIKTYPDKKAIRSQYEEYEKNEWIPLCNAKLNEWIKNNAFEAKIEENRITEYENIKLDYNRLRYRKILQIIQDSGIGLGQGSSGKGYYAGPEDFEKFTGSSE